MELSSRFGYLRCCLGAVDCSDVFIYNEARWLLYAQYNRDAQDNFQNHLPSWRSEIDTNESAVSYRVKHQYAVRMNSHVSSCVSISLLLCENECTEYRYVHIKG